MRPLTRLLDGSALRHNYEESRRRAAAPKLLAVVKSRAYGHGLRFAADALRDVADGFGVVEIADVRAIRRRGVGAPVLLMNGAFSRRDLASASELNAWTAVHSHQQTRWLLDSRPAGMHAFVKVDIGMNRLGFSAAEAADVMDALKRAGIQTSLMAHFARADEPGGVKKPLRILNPLRPLAHSVSLGNSAASLLQGDIGDEWGRVGIALYGSSPAPAWRNRDALGLSPVMTLKTKLIAVREVRTGQSVGYGGTWRAKKAVRAGIAAVGYGDGYPRSRGRLWALVDGRKAPVLGRVSMELIALDLSRCPSAKPGAEVVCWGESPSIDEVAAAAGRISYEILTSASAYRGAKLAP